jgi:uncharacterized protein YdeI (BOF family)
MKKGLMVFAVALWMAAPAFAADKTWNGTISDSNCGAKHAAGEEHGAKMSKADCVKACVEQHNAKYVFVSGDKVYNIENQDFAGLKTHAGHNVALSGEMKGDTITVSKIEMPAAKSDKK